MREDVDEEIGEEKEAFLHTWLITHFFICVMVRWTAKTEQKKSLSSRFDIETLGQFCAQFTLCVSSWEAEE